MCPQYISLSLSHLPVVLVADGAFEAVLVRVFDARGVVLGDLVAALGVGEEEGVVGFAGGVGLGLEEGVEVPEGGLHISLGRHFVESHLKEDFAELGASFQQRVEVTALGVFAK